MWSFFEFLRDDCSLTILDVGAAMLESPSYQGLVDARRARLIGFEPDEEARRWLMERYGEPHLFLPHFVGDGQAAVFHETSAGATGSLFAANMSLVEKFNDLAELMAPLRSHSVQTVRLDDITETDDVDFIKIDVQGSELSIFRNASRALASAVLIQTEVGFVELYKGQPLFADVDKFLHGAGFQFHDFCGFAGRAFKPVINPSQEMHGYRQKLWADAYYVKDWTQLDRLPPDKLRKMAALSHDVLGSYDLAYLALREIDRKMGSTLAAGYMQRLQRSGRGVRSGTAPQTSTQVDDQLPVKDTGEQIEENGGQCKPGTMSLQTVHGLFVSVPATLECITTYVLLEQERWFEREIDFLLRYLKPGMNVIDIGANLGMYSLPLARAVGENGFVVAFEPGADARALLTASKRANGLDNLVISECALSNAEKDGWLKIEGSSELNALCEASASMEGIERVKISTLDVQDRCEKWRDVDFVKIDAEGQEARILAGGRLFFQHHSPLVMYEVMHGSQKNEALRWMFESQGYATYRLLGDATLLVPVVSDEALDPFELNLFGAKPERAAQLAESGLLVAATVEYRLKTSERDLAIVGMLAQPYARAFELSSSDINACPFGNALVAYAAYRYAGLLPAERFAALRFSYASLSAYCQENSSFPAMATLARIALDLGVRSVAVGLLGQILADKEQDIDQPFFPPCPRYETLAPDENVSDWFMAAAAEQLERSRSHSARFSPSAMSRLEWLTRGRFASPEMVRRLILRAAALGMEQKHIASFMDSGQGHCNRSYWTPAGLPSLLSLFC